MTKKRKHHQNDRSLTSGKSGGYHDERYDAERKHWQQSDRDRRCPGCNGLGVQVTPGRWEPHARCCPICQNAPHPAEEPHAHVRSLDGEHFFESNWRCEACGGCGDVTGHYTGEHGKQSHTETCPDCAGLGVHVMPGGNLQLYAQPDVEALTNACEAAIRELEAVQRCDGYAPSTATVIRRLYRALGKQPLHNEHVPLTHA